MGSALMLPSVRGKSARQVIVDYLFHTRRARAAGGAFLDFLVSRHGLITEGEMSRFADELAAGAFGPPFSRRTFYSSIRPRFLQTKLVMCECDRDDSGKLVRQYWSILQPISIRRPECPSLIYDAHLVCESWNLLFPR